MNRPLIFVWMLKVKIAVLLCFITGLWMTGSATNQVPELVVYKMDTFAVHNTPLQPLLEKDSTFLSKHLPNGVWHLSSACWRGYRGTWMVWRDSLFLVQLGPCDNGDYQRNPFDITQLFPNQVTSRGVFASWVTDTLSLGTDSTPYFAIKDGLLDRFAYPAQDSMIQWIYDQKEAANQGEHPGRPYRIVGLIIVIGCVIILAIARPEGNAKA